MVENLLSLSMMLTMLVIAVSFIALNIEEHRKAWKSAFSIGILLFICELILSFADLMVLAIKGF